ncbi:toprim domain-containing protein [Endozoicomonadaceae bacterium StTr2]
MMDLEDLKARIDLHQLAQLLDMRRASGSVQGNASYHSPVREDRHPSVSIYRRNGHQRWKDHATGEGGSCIDLVIYAGKATTVAEASQWLHDAFAIPHNPDGGSYQSAAEPQSKEEWLAERCLVNAEAVQPYLIEQRSISPAVIAKACDHKTLGYSDYTSSKPAGEVFHGGPAAAFICRKADNKAVTAVEYRYIDAALNGGIKNHCHGHKGSAFWCIDPTAVASAHTIVVVESAINALSVETSIAQYPQLAGWTALATLGASNLHEKDWTRLAGKRVLIAMDNDQPDQRPGPRQGLKPGATAAWTLHEQLLNLNIAAHLLDHSEWQSLNDLNDVLQQQGVDAVYQLLHKTEPWLIPGVNGHPGNGRGRLWLPAHDYSRYSQFRVQEDFTCYQRQVTDRTGEQQTITEDLCGFRLAALSRIHIQSAAATMSGRPDNQPVVVFAASIQTPRHGNRLVRQVIVDDQLYNLERWRSIGGAIYKPVPFTRMLNILERATNIGSRDAINFVGLAWRNGQPAVNQGPDCYFSEPDRQCPYYNLQFPSGPIANARRVLLAWQQTFKANAATLLLLWSLGAHLKAYLGFWPHMVLQADKGAGKSTLIKQLEQSIGFTMFSGQSLHTEFRLVTSVSHTSHPVGWEELSARRTEVIDRAVALLQETYQYTITRRGPEMTEYVLCAPVLLAGEDVPVQSLLGKVVRTELEKKGELLPNSLPCFPVKEWLDFLITIPAQQIKDRYQQQLLHLSQYCSIDSQDNSVARMVGNYAALATSWQLLCEFSGLSPHQGNTPRDLLKAMNTHVLETHNDREPWVWIMEIILGEIDAGHYLRPFRYELHGDDCLLFIRTPHIMQHLSQTPALRSKYDALPVKTDRALKKQLLKAGVLSQENEDRERRINGQRCAHMSGLSLAVLEQYGLSPMLPDDPVFLNNRNNL